MDYFELTGESLRIYSKYMYASIINSIPLEVLIAGNKNEITKIGYILLLSRIVKNYRNGIAYFFVMLILHTFITYYISSTPVWSLPRRMPGSPHPYFSDTSPSDHRPSPPCPVLSDRLPTVIAQADARPVLSISFRWASVWPSPRQTPGLSCPYPSDRPAFRHRSNRRQARHVHILQIRFWPPPSQTPGPSLPYPPDKPSSGRHPGRRQARHADILLIDLRLATAQADAEPIMSISFK